MMIMQVLATHKDSKNFETICKKEPKNERLKLAQYYNDERDFILASLNQAPLLNRQPLSNREDPAGKQLDGDLSEHPNTSALTTTTPASSTSSHLRRVPPQGSDATKNAPLTSISLHEKFESWDACPIPTDPGPSPSQRISRHFFSLKGLSCFRSPSEPVSRDLVDENSKDFKMAIDNSAAKIDEWYDRLAKAEESTALPGPDSAKQARLNMGSQEVALEETSGSESQARIVRGPSIRHDPRSLQNAR